MAGGNGLICCEWHARAIGKIFGLDIEVYGFDSGRGLPPPLDHRDLPHIFGPNYYAMDDQALLRERLNGAHLVIGDIRETAASFLDQFQPAPIGVMLIDVDSYHSALAVRNFNAASQFIKIAPETVCIPPNESLDRDYNSFLYRLKEAHRFHHPL